MVPSNGASSLTKKVEDNILGVLRERERELDDIIHDYSLLENKLARNRDEETLENLREARLRELKETHLRRNEFLARGYGRLLEVYSDKEFFDACRDADAVVVHFYRPTTARCSYLDAQLTKLADSHFSTKFIKVNAEKTPFICDRFNIWCIPTLMIIKEGKTNHSIVGFDEFGGIWALIICAGDGFSLDDLSNALARHGIEQYGKKM